MKGVILDADSLGNVDLDPITTLAGTWSVYGFTTHEQVSERIADANIVLTNKVVVGPAEINKAGNLGLISVMATGTNNIDLAAARQHRIDVCNAVAYATPSVVQHTISLMLALANNLISYAADVRAGRWQESRVFCLLDHPITELSGKKLGILGYGELGSAVANVAQAFGMEILVSGRPGEPATAGRHAFDAMLAEVDYLSLHCPLTEATREIINATTLGQMKQGSFLINTARGGLVNSLDLIAALRSGHIAGAALDVVNVEPPAADEPLLDPTIPNLIVTPHSAWAAIESRQRLVRQMQENIQAWQQGKPVRCVND
ncbi:MAG: D-2-hydroxyacid dehydrogenase [Pseudomonadota bacterium]